MNNRGFVLLLICFFVRAFILAQEIVNLEILDTGSGSGVNYINRNTTRFLIDDERYYFWIEKVDGVSDKDFGIDIDNWDSLLHDTHKDVGSGTYKLLMEYGIGEGVVDYDIANIPISFRAFDVNNRRIALTAYKGIMGFNNVMYSDTTNDREMICVVDMNSDSLLYFDQGNDMDDMDDIDILLDGDYLYYTNVFNLEQPFMDTMLTHIYPIFGNQSSTVVHKINWRTGERMWTRHTGTYDFYDEIIDMKLLDNGDVVLALRVEAPVTWGDEYVDVWPYYTGVTAYNTAFVRISPHGEYVNHVTLHNYHGIVTPIVNIEDDGTIYTAGGLIQGHAITMRGDTIAQADSSTTGILIKLDGDMQLDWVSQYPNTFCTSANSTPDGNTLVSLWLYDEPTIINSDTVYNEYYEYYYNDETMTFHPDMPMQSVFIELNSEGLVISEPILFGRSQVTTEIQEIAKDHYLFFIYNISYQHFVPEFLEVEVGKKTGFFTMMLEVKGDLFSSVTKVLELTEQSDIRVYPNPTTDYLNVSLPFDGVSDKVEVSLYDSRGTELRKLAYDQNNELKINMKDLYPGPYILDVKYGKIRKSQIVIKQ